MASPPPVSEARERENLVEGRRSSLPCGDRMQKKLMAGHFTDF